MMRAFCWMLPASGGDCFFSRRSIEGIFQLGSETATRAFFSSVSTFLGVLSGLGFLGSSLAMALLTLSSPTPSLGMNFSLRSRATLAFCLSSVALVEEKMAEIFLKMVLGVILKTKRTVMKIRTA